MSKHMITFVGDIRAKSKDRSDPDSVTFRGIEFPLRQPVAFEATSAEGHALLAKLKANHHFEVVPAGEAPAVETGVAAQPGTPETDADPRNPNVHPEAVSPEAEQKRADRAAKRAAKA